MFSACTGLTAAPDLPATTLADYCYAGMFRDCSGLTAAPDLPATTLAKGCYMNMFYNCTNLTAAPVLPATTLANYCYSALFKGCDKLNYVKCLATNIDAKDCTDDWLNSVSSSGTFVKAPEMDKWTPDSESGIPSGWTVENVVTASKYLTFTSEGTTTISLSCFSSNTPKLFYSYDKTNWTKWDYSALEFTSSSPLYLCGDNPGGFSSGLGTNQFVDDGSNYGVSGDIMSLLDYDNDIKEIPSIKCFSSLFYGCKLTEAPSLPATTLTEGCYSYMFRNCANLKVAPDLPATKLPELCYASMFTGCSGLQTAPEEIPASTLEKSCCEFMFQKCTSLKVAPNLPATTLAIMCYRDMFDGCTSLTTAPEELPATTLAESCYLSMFKGCYNLTTVPEELPATTLATSCYRNMFYECSKLQTAPVLPAAKLVESCYQSMFGSCTILNYVKCLAKNIDAELCTTNWLKGVNSSGTFVMASGMDKWTLDSESGIPAGWTVENVFTASKYLTFTSEGTTNLKLTDIGGNKPKLYYSYDKTTWTEWDHNNITFTSSSPLYLCGDNTSGFNFTSSQYSTFSATGSLFDIDGSIMSLLDKDITLAEIPCDSCFIRLFNQCQLLHGAPDLPATTLKKSCYRSMFYYCTNLSEAPELPATIMAPSCYSSMFMNCTSLIEAPELKSTTLADACYEKMFSNCSNLVTPPVLAAEKMEYYCYAEMFKGTNLTQAPCLPATDLAEGCYSAMFYNCESLTGAPDLIAMELKEKCYYAMFHNCKSLETAPELPASTLEKECYRLMFSGCSKLNYVKCLATNIEATNCTANWLDAPIAQSGTFFKAATMNDWLTDSPSGIPQGWTVKDVN